MILLIHLLYAIKFLNNPVSSNFYFIKYFSWAACYLPTYVAFQRGVLYMGGYMLQRPSNGMHSLTVQMFTWVYASDKSKLMRMVMAQHSLSYLVNSERRKIKNVLFWKLWILTTQGKKTLSEFYGFDFVDNKVEFPQRFSSYVTQKKTIISASKLCSVMRLCL